MANQIKQFRYYSEAAFDGVSKNQPSKLDDGTIVSYTHFVSGDVFGSCFPVSQLGIQALPGTKFYLNNATEPIIVGFTGLYELDLNQQTEITKIQIDVNSMKEISENSNAYLLIDIIYDNGEE